MGAAPASGTCWEALVIKQVVISGYYGFNNSGDEAVLASILQSLREASDEVEPVVLSGNPAFTEQAYGVRAVSRTDLKAIHRAIRSSDGLISGGGSLLQDVTGWTTIPYYLGIILLAQWAKKPTFIYSQGVGPVTRKMFHPLIKKVFQRTVYISVRDLESAAFLNQIGISSEKINIVPDPVMGLRPISHREAMELLRVEGIPTGEPASEVRTNVRASEVRTGELAEFVDPAPEGSPAERVPAGSFAEHAPEGSPSGKRLIGIAIRFWQGNQRLLEEVAKCADQLAESGYTVVFLPFHQPEDIEASREVILKMKHKAYLLEHQVSPQELMGVVGCCRALIGMRLHSLIYAAAQKTPLVGISYDPKIDNFLGQLGLTAAGSVEQITGERLIAHIEPILHDENKWRANVNPAIEELKQKANAPAQQITQLLRRR